MKFLILSSLFEIIWVNLLKIYTDTPSKLLLLSLVVITMIASFYFLAIAIKTVPLTFAYAVWTSSGLVGTAFIQHVYFQNQLSPQSWVAVILIVVGIFLFNQSEAQ